MCFTFSVQSVSLTGIHDRSVFCRASNQTPRRHQNWWAPTKCFVEVNGCESYSESWAETALSSLEQSSPAAALLPAAAFIPPYTAAKEMGARGVFKSTYYYTTLASLSHAWMRQVTGKKKKTTVIKWVINNCIRMHKRIRLGLGKQPKNSGEFEFEILVIFFQQFFV